MNTSTNFEYNLIHFICVFAAWSSIPFQMINDVQMQVMADTWSFGCICCLVFHYLSFSYSMHFSLFFDAKPKNSDTNSWFDRVMCECFVLPFMQHWLNDDVFMILFFSGEENTITSYGFFFCRCSIFLYLVSVVGYSSFLMYSLLGECCCCCVSGHYNL